MKNSIKSFIKAAASSVEADEDQRRREVILNVILLVSLFCFSVLNIVRIVDFFVYPKIEGLPLWTTFAILLFFGLLFFLSKRGKAKLSAWLTIITYSLPMLYCLVVWGTDLPAALLLAVLIIAMSGILIGEQMVMIATGVISLALLGITIGQQGGMIQVQSYWRHYPTTIGDIVTYSVLLLVAAFTTWIFSRDIKRSLKRARTSEKALKEERDSLEIKVQERTAELHQAEAEKINQLYRLAEFGRLSSGIFHDLINPLTAVSLNLEQIQDRTGNQISSAKSYLGQALVATKKMEDLIASIKRQLQRQSQIVTFSVNKEIEQAIQILNYKARRAGVEIIWQTEHDTDLRGDAVKFSQIIINLLANAIEACENTNKEKKITINITEGDQNLAIIVSDQGEGIAPENLEKIFEPFFTTKSCDNRGLGLGLASTKSIAEKDFKGKITVASELGKGAEFTVLLPI